MPRPAIFFDRDNTLIVGNDYLGDPAAVELVPGAAAAVARANHLGYDVVVVSNQSGVARGKFAESDVRAVNARVDELLLAGHPDALVERHAFCPHHPEAEIEAYRTACDCRKPRPGMILAAAAELGLDLPFSWLIGDAPRDIEAGAAAGCRAILFRDPSLPPSPAAAEAEVVKPEFVAETLTEAMDYVERHTRRGLALKAVEPKPVEAAAESVEPVTPMPVEPIAPPAPSDDRIVDELRKLNDHFEAHFNPADFSVARLLAGVMQVLALAVLFLAYLNAGETIHFLGLLLTAVFAQVLTATLLVFDMNR